MSSSRANGMDHGNGWFGNHSKGFYGTRMLTTTFTTSGMRILSHAMKGRSCSSNFSLVGERILTVNGVQPLQTHHCHESPNHLELYLYYDSTVCILVHKLPETHSRTTTVTQGEGLSPRILDGSLPSEMHSGTTTVTQSEGLSPRVLDGSLPSETQSGTTTVTQVSVRC